MHLVFCRALPVGMSSWAVELIHKTPDFGRGLFLYIDDNDENNLHSQNSRDANVKTGLPDFVPYQIHSNKHAETATNAGRTQQNGFRNAIMAFFSFMLVCKHKKETYRIDY